MYTMFKPPITADPPHTFETRKKNLGLSREITPLSASDSALFQSANDMLKKAKVYDCIKGIEKAQPNMPQEKQIELEQTLEKVAGGLAAQVEVIVMRSEQEGLKKTDEYTISRPGQSR